MRTYLKFPFFHIYFFKSNYNLICVSVHPICETPEAELTLGIFLHCSLCYFLKWSLSMNLELINWLDWLTSELFNPPASASASQKLDYMCTQPYLTFKVDTEHLNSSPYAYKASHQVTHSEEWKREVGDKNWHELESPVQHREGNQEGRSAPQKQARRIVVEWFSFSIIHSGYFPVVFANTVSNWLQHGDDLFLHSPTTGHFICF